MKYTIGFPLLILTVIWLLSGCVTSASKELRWAYQQGVPIEAEYWDGEKHWRVKYKVLE